MYATVDTNSKFYIDKFEDLLEPGSDLSEDNKGV